MKAKAKPRTVEFPRILVDMGDMGEEVRRMAQQEDRPISSQVRYLLRIALAQLNEEKKKRS